MKLNHKDIWPDTKLQTTDDTLDRYLKEDVPSKEDIVCITLMKIMWKHYLQIQYFGDTITICYTIHSITIRHHVSHTIEITLSNTARHIKTNNALINNTLTQFLYTSYRYNP